MSLTLLALATRTSEPHSSSKRLTQGEWVPTSMAIFSRWCMESKRSRKASGVVRSRLSPTISPLWASRRHRDGCACPRDPARLSSLGAPCYHSSWADSSFHSEPIWSSYTYCRPTGYCAGDRPSHLIFREHPLQHHLGGTTCRTPP